MGRRPSPPKRSACALLAAACTIAPAWVAGAQPAPTHPTTSGARPTGSGRLVRLFDFEEAAFNPEVVPRYWVRAQHDPPSRERPGFPPFNRAAFDKAVALSGAASVRLPTAGGSTSLRLGGSVIPVFADADYLITAAVKTEGLEHARALVAARLLTQAGEIVPGSEFRSPAVLSPEGWTTISATVPGRFESAAFMQIELLVLQPEPEAGESAHLSVPRQDIAGAAWFDDVTVFQLPRVTLSARDHRAVVYAPDRPALVGVIRDLTGEALTVRLTLHDMHGRVLADEMREIGAGGETFDWTPVVGRFGWYEATMEVVAHGTVISRSRTTLVYAPPPVLAPSPRSGAPATLRPATLPLHIAVDELRAHHAAEAGDLLLAAGAGSISVPIDAAMDAGDDVAARTAQVSALVDRLLESDAAVSLWVPRLPRDLARSLQVSPDQVLALGQADPRLWGGALQPMLDRYSQRIERWQLGPAEAPDEPPDAAERAQRVGAFKQWLARMVPGPLVASSWRADWPALPEGHGPIDGTLLTIPASFPVQAVDAVGRELVSRRQGAPVEPGDLSVLLDLPDEATFGPAAVVEECMQRIILSWVAMSLGEQSGLSAGAPPRVKVALRQPWTVDEAARPALLPTATLPALKVLSEHLCARRVLGRLATPPGLHAYILAPVREPGSAQTALGGGALVAWSEGDDDATSRLRVYLGSPTATEVDAMGNERTLTAADAGGLYDLRLSPLPVFIEGVDPELCLFVTGVRVEPEFVPAISAMHEHELVIMNPWPLRISGTVQLVPDGGAGVGGGRRAWSFAPTSPMTFSIAPGSSQRLPFEFTFPASEEAGPRTITALLSVTAAQTYSALRAQAPIVIGSRNLDMSAVAQVGPQSTGPDVVLTVSVTNTGRAARTLEVNVHAPGLPQQRQPISNLMPGESSVRRFVFVGRAADLSGKRIRVTLNDVDGAERLNRAAVVP